MEARLERDSRHLRVLNSTFTVKAGFEQCHGYGIHRSFIFVSYKDQGPHPNPLISFNPPDSIVPILNALLLILPIPRDVNTLA